MQKTKHALFRPAIAAVFILCATMLSTGCNKRTQHDVFNLPSGPGWLVLHEDHLQTFETTYVKYELRYIEGKKIRLVDTLKPGTSIYAEPTPDEHYHHFRNDRTNNACPIFVNPAQFSLAEYEQIRQTLASNLVVIDKAVSRPREPVRYFRENRQPMITSIRYTDYDGFRRIYLASNKHTLTVEPDGQVWWGRRLGFGGSGSALIGRASGRRVLLAPYNIRWTESSPGKNIYTQANIQQWKCANGHTIFDDFEVNVSASEADYDAAMFGRRKSTTDRP
jgi:hypothetical protein